jgi:YHS domain-containing protein
MFTVRALSGSILLASAFALAGAPLGCASSGGVSSPSAASGERMLVNRDSKGVAIQGYDPVAYFTEMKPVKGSPEFASSHGGAIYHFASARHKSMFDADPVRYTPQFGGYCGYAASINKVSPIDPNYWEVIDGRLVLQHNQKAWDLWHKDVPGNLAKADANWPGLVRRHGT